jgi:MoaA/NifB/PqqE/SkfB family radical SAM enzyme
MKYSELRSYIAAHPRLAGIYDGHAVLAGPEEVWLDLTNRCNTRCICCGHRSPELLDQSPPPEWHAQEMPREKALALVRELGELGARRIFFSGGGEPILHPHVFEIISSAQRSGVSALLTTNLLAAGDEMLERMLESGLDRIVVSLLAATPETYAAVHPGMPPSSFDHIIRMLKKLARIRSSPTKPEIILYTVMMRSNAGEVEPMIKLALEIDAAGIWWNPMALPSPRLKDLLLTREQIAWLGEEMPRMREKYRARIQPWQWEMLEFSDFLEKIRNSRAHEGVYHTDIIDTIPCYAGWILTRILPDGTVVPCCRGGAFTLGTVRDAPFRDVWFSPAYHDFRQRALSLSKCDPYFARINCPVACDNHWWNKKTDRELHDAACPLPRLGVFDRWRFRRALHRMP